MLKLRAWVDFASWSFFLLGLACLGLVAGMMYVGHPYAIPHVVYVEQPIPHLACGLAALLAWHVLRRGYRYSRREWSVFAGRCALLAISAFLALAAGEKLYHSYLKWKLGQNSLERLKNMRSSGHKITVQSAHALASIIQPSDDMRVVYELQPNLDMEFGHLPLRTNADGLREDTDYPVSRLPRSVRIIGLGDSGIFGWNVGEGDNYLDVMEVNLRQRKDGVTYEALNFGVPGYNTRLEVEALRSKGLKYKPDVVVVGWCANDFGLPFFMWEKESFDSQGCALYSLFFCRTNIPSDAGYKFRDQRNLSPEDKELILPDATVGTDIKGVYDAMNDLKSLSQAQGFHFLVFGPMKKEVLQICRELGISYYNTLEKIGPDEYPAEWAVHFMHPRGEGHRVLAERLERELDDLGWLQPKS